MNADELDSDPRAIGADCRCHQLSAVSLFVCTATQHHIGVSRVFSGIRSRIYSSPHCAMVMGMKEICYDRIVLQTLNQIVQRRALNDVDISVVSQDRQC